MQKQSEDLISAIAAAQMRAIELDLEIELDILKYSSWWSVIASGGLGIVLATWKAIAVTAQLHHARVALLLIAIPLLISVCVGTYVNWKLNQSFACKRKQMTMPLKQQILLMTAEDIAESSRVFAGRALALGYLEVKDLKVCEELDTQAKKAGNVQRLLVSQQVLAVVGYVLVLVAVVALG